MINITPPYTSPSLVQNLLSDRSCTPLLYFDKSDDKECCDGLCKVGLKDIQI